MSSENNEKILITCCISGGVFRNFAKYDAFQRRKAWRGSLILSMSLFLTSLIFFIGLRDGNFAKAFGRFFFISAVVIPVIWVTSLNPSITKQIKERDIRETIAQYFVELSDNGVVMSKGKDKVNFTWNEICRVVFNKDCAYMFVNEDRALLLPYGSDFSKAEELILSNLPEEKIEHI